MNYKKNNSLVTFLILMGFTTYSSANQLELTNYPSKQSPIANRGVALALTPLKNSVLVVGERGHAYLWQKTSLWQQHNVPVRVTLTDVVNTKNGDSIAVGHDGVIVKLLPDAKQWKKVFDGYQLDELKISTLKKQLKTLKADDSLNADELEEQLEELTFALEDAQIEQSDGPNKPLLSITQASNGHLFAVGAYGIALESKNDGQTWQQFSHQLNNPDTFHLNAVVSTAAGNVYIVGEKGLGFKSADNGLSWTQMPLPYTGSLFGITKHDENLVAFGLQGNYMVSFDGGQQWQHQKIKSSVSLLGGTVDVNGRVYLVGHGGLVIDFDLRDPKTYRVKKHSSGATFSDVIINKGSLLFAGQFGIASMDIK
jgi:photosystem II stability/assembly factor-like uncharacterized protein